METKISGREVSKDVEREDHQDRLSKLPDTILFHILEELTMHEAARTSVLSRYWVHLFKQRSSIIMDIKDFYPKGNQDFKPSHDELVEINVKFVQATKSMLQCERLIRTFLIKFHMMEEAIDIVRNVDKAMTNRKIASLQFVLYPESGEGYCPIDLKINNGRLLMGFIGAGPRAFGALNHLHIWCVKLSIDDMLIMLNTCNNLEHLNLYQCHLGHESIITIEHPQLVTLTFVFCIYQTVELRWLPRLTRLTCKNWMEKNGQYPISFGYAPQLSTLILQNSAMIHHKIIQLSEFLSNNVMIREMDLDFQSLKVWIQPEAPKFLGPVLQNLQLLCLRSIREECSLDWTMFFLEAAPLLKKVHVQVWDHPFWGRKKDETLEHIQYCEQQYPKDNNHLSWQAPDDLKHYCLEELIISGYQMKRAFNRYIKRVLKAAVKLERVTLLKNDPCEESYLCKHCMFPHFTLFPRNKGESSMVKRQISQWASSPIEIKLDAFT